MIIKASELNKITREDIIDLFCESLMNNIKEANKKGRREALFHSTIYRNEKTNELSATFREDWRKDGVDSPYRFNDYEREIERKFISFGYVVKPTGYIGGVWQLTKDIMW